MCRRLFKTSLRERVLSSSLLFTFLIAFEQMICSLFTRKERRMTSRHGVLHLLYYPCYSMMKKREAFDEKGKLDCIFFAESSCMKTVSHSASKSTLKSYQTCLCKTCVIFFMGLFVFKRYYADEFCRVSHKSKRGREVSKTMTMTRQQKDRQEEW